VSIRRTAGRSVPYPPLRICICDGTSNTIRNSSALPNGTNSPDEQPRRRRCFGRTYRPHATTAYRVPSPPLFRSKSSVILLPNSQTLSSFFVLLPLLRSSSTTTTTGTGRTCRKISSSFLYRIGSSNFRIWSLPSLRNSPLGSGD